MPNGGGDGGGRDMFADKAENEGRRMDGWMDGWT
jgi:hypothetical protein